jgi:hypothetical protein
MAAVRSTTPLYMCLDRAANGCRHAPPHLQAIESCGELAWHARGRRAKVGEQR